MFKDVSSVQQLNTLCPVLEISRQIIMPWYREAMKDVGTCDKPRGAGNQAVILGFPNGATPPKGDSGLNA